MEVNGVDVSRFCAKFWGIEKGRLSVANATEAMDASRIPVMMRPAIGLREYTVTIHVYGASRMEMWENAGKVINLFTGAVSKVKVPGFPGRYFMLSLTGVNGAGHGGILKDRWYVLSLACVGYECADREACIRLDKLKFQDDDADAPEFKLTYEAGLEEICQEALQGMPPEPVQADILVEQTNKVYHAGDMYPGIEGKAGAMDAQIRIYGLCISRTGKDMGPLSIRAKPDTHRYPGTGLTGIKIDGRSGRAEEFVNIAADYWMDYSLPAPMSWGHPDQKVRVEITAYNTLPYYPKYEISFFYTPVYI